MNAAAELESLHASDKRLVRTVDGLTDAQWREPSVLPGWSRAHVVAHLALNAEAMAAAFEGLAEGEIVPLYPSDEDRDGDIATLASADVPEIRERLFAATTRFQDAARGLPDEAWTGGVHRLPEGPVWPAATLPGTRRREVEIHHADLDAGYAPADWPADFVADLLTVVTHDRRYGDGEPFAVHAVDLGRTWDAGAPTPVVEGSGSDLGWWIVGRGSGAGLTSSSGTLPSLGAWRRAPAK
ncbi:MAG: maleylpyruvate isomerase family mycothiol-dependent enzyme [Nocardioidaceae bacterium]|nr:maleylpyruvate isomerase family mycothiol-dependent enzyme [Nocardioidaceae bacterium]